MYIVYISADKIIKLQNFHTNFGICFDTEDRLFQKERKNIHKNLSLTRQICQIHPGDNVEAFSLYVVYTM